MSPDPDLARAEYLARLKARLIASRDGAPPPASAAPIVAPPALPPEPCPDSEPAPAPAPTAPEPVQSSQPSGYSESSQRDDHPIHPELAALASALENVASRALEAARAIRGA